MLNRSYLKDRILSVQFFFWDFNASPNSGTQNFNYLQKVILNGLLRIRLRNERKLLYEKKHKPKINLS